MKKLYKLLALSLLTLTGYNANAQVSSYTQDFDNGLDSWTGGWSNTTSQTCNGSSPRKNIYNATTSAAFESPLLGMFAAESYTLTFDYKIVDWSAATVATANTFGTIDVEYSADGSTWITIGTIDASNHVVANTCANMSMPFTPSAGDLYVRFDCSWNTGDYYIYFDDINIELTTPPTCPQPTDVDTANVVFNGADISWTSGGASNWNIEFGPAGFTPGTGTFVSNITNPYTISGLNEQTDYEVYVQDSCGNGDVSFWSVVSFTTPPACVAPTALTVTGVTDTGAILGWTSSGAPNANVEFGPSGFSPGMGTMIIDAANPFTLDTLTPNTTYDFYVQDSCGSGNSSPWTGPTSFTTELATCNTLTPVNLPFIEDFESINDSVVGNANIYCGTDKAWDFLTNNQGFGRLRIGSFSPEVNGGNGAVMMDVQTSGPLTANELVLTLDMSNYTSTDNVFLSFEFGEWGDENHTGDRVWIRGSNTDTWIEAFNWNNLVSDDWYVVDKGVFVTSLLVGNSQMFTNSFQIKFGQEDDFDYNLDGFSLDNVKLELVTCPNPTDLAVVSQNMDSVVLNWNIGSAETMWNVEYGIAGYTPGMGTMVMSADTTDTIVGLDLGAVYDFYVQADCGSGDVSSWVGPITVATPILNDEPCDAVIVMPNTDYSSVAFSNIDATTQANEATRVPGTGTHNNTVWFKTVVPASGHIMIATCGSDFTTRLGVYAGDTAICDSLETFGFIASATFGNFALCGNSSYAGLELCGQNPGDTLLFYVGGSTSTQEGIINLTVTDLNLEGFAGEGVAQSVAICAGDTLDLFSQLSGQLLNVGEWTYPSNPSAIINNASINTGLMSLVGNEVYYSLENGCDQDTATVMINPVAKTNTGMAISNFQACSNGDVFLFDALTGTIDAGGTWSTNTGAPFNGNKFIANGLPNGPYQFTYSLDNGVCAPSSTEVEINLVSCTSISEDESTTFGVYPNPNDGNFFISNGNIESNVVMEVLDVQGKVIFSNTYVMAAGAQQEISLGNVRSGVYLVRIVTNNQVFNSNVVVK